MDEAFYWDMGQRALQEFATPEYCALPLRPGLVQAGLHGLSTWGTCWYGRCICCIWGCAPETWLGMAGVWAEWLLWQAASYRAETRLRAYELMSWMAPVVGCKLT
eukprot:scaffold122900_cov18-Tisochrysis_lutea.AAC.1